ncbi:SDR family NAD(P)-dependent oxidoreductase [Glaciihabitans sp. UYNi722]|uniref:SDR family NAD(P)-dependent oxidoreductase n=1 Tax=Glaciihabitans sp. UYNi722 TaxID=3156344 RepID=UPI00339298E1
MTLTLITGANKGLGFETARRLIGLGHTVYIGARDAAKGQEAADSLGARFVQLDVTDQQSVDAAARHLRENEGSLDVLINNAGIAGDHIAPPDATADDVRHVFDTNVFGLVRVTHSFLPLLQESDTPVIVNVTSGMGSFAVTMDPARFESTLQSVAYSPSKTAVTMMTTQYAKSLPGIRINAVDPGYTGTDLNSFRGTQTVEQGTDAIVRLATIGQDGPTGTFQDAAGTVPW